MSIAKRILGALCLVSWAGALFAVDPTSLATGAMTDSATEAAIDKATEKGSEMAKEQLLGKDSQKAEDAKSESEDAEGSAGDSEKKAESGADKPKSESGEESMIDKATKLFK